MLVNDFYNKAANRLKQKYFPYVRHGIDDNECYYKYRKALEDFSNGCITYNTLLNKLTKALKTDKTTIHNIVSRYIISEFNFSIKG
jgi:hypothetical protein